MNKQRPVNLDLTSIQFPVTSISSILHRITGVILVVGIPILLWLLSQTLESEAGYAKSAEFAASGFGKFVIWGILSALFYHIVAGIRHLIMDAGIGETYEGGRLGSQLSLAISALGIIGLGVWLW